MMKPSKFWEEASAFLGSDQLVGAMRDLLAVALFDLRDRSIVGLTPRAVRLFGYEEESDLVGTKIEKLIPERFHKSHRAYVDQYAENPRTLQMGERRLPGIRKDGKEFTQTIWLIPSSNEFHVLAVFFD